MTKGKEYLIASIFSLVFVIMGIVMVYFAFKIYNNIHELRKYGIKTYGTIIRYERRRGTKTNDYSIVPIVKFKTVSTDEEFIIEGHMDNRKLFQNICKAGDEVEIIYDANNPNKAVINTFAELWFMPILLWIIGFSFIFFPPYTVYKEYKKDFNKNGL